MKKGTLTFFAVLLTALLSGCGMEKIAEGIAAKNVSGNGTVIDSHIGINTETRIPELRTLFISGDIATTKAGSNAISYREESSSSIFNAKSVQKKRFLSITLNDGGDIPATIRAIAEIFNASGGTGEKPVVEIKAAAKTEENGTTVPAEDSKKEK